MLCSCKHEEHFITEDPNCNSYIIIKEKAIIIFRMDGSIDECSKISGSRENSVKDLNISRSSIKSTKSLERNTNSHSNGGSLKSDKDVHFAKSSLKSKSDSDNQKHNVDASLKVPHKIIANWRQACDRTRDRTRDLLKRWRTLPEFEAAENDPSKKGSVCLEKTESQTESCGWSVHVWSL